MKISLQLVSAAIVLCLCINCNDNDSTENPSLLDIGFDKNEEKKDTSVSVEDPVFNKLSNLDTIHYGLDISHYQGDLLSEMDSSDSIKFIICKATQGTNYVDPDFRTNWHEIKTKGFIRGAYHFYDCSADPIAQADHFSNSIDDIERTDIAPILDIEQGGLNGVSPEQMEMDILKFLERLESNLHRKPMIYTDYAFAQEYFKNSEIANYDLWLAEYNGEARPQVPDLWKSKGYEIWQRSDSYSIHSVHADLDVVFGSLNKIVN